jgi:hypothetical protein
VRKIKRLERFPFRYRNGEQKMEFSIADAIAEIKKVVAERTQV